MKTTTPAQWLRVIRKVGTICYIYERLGYDLSLQTMETTCKSCKLKKVSMTLADLQTHVQAHYFLSKLDQQAMKYLAGRTKPKKSKNTGAVKLAH